jgi:peptidoglycan/LPS O-acetylase OafA/YrhL
VLSLPIGSWVSIVMIPTAFMLYELAFSDGLPARLFSSGPSVLLGGASYAIYLLQYPVRASTKLLFSFGGPSFSFLGGVLTPGLLIAFFDRRLPLSGGACKKAPASCKLIG